MDWAVRRYTNLTLTEEHKNKYITKLRGKSGTLAESDKNSDIKGDLLQSSGKLELSGK